MSAIQTELLGSVSIKRRNNEPEQKFWGRLAEAVVELADDDWEKLSKPAQSWTNRAIKALNKEIDIPEFADSVREQEDDDDDAEDEAKKVSAHQRRTEKVLATNGEDEDDDVEDDANGDDDEDDDEDEPKEVLQTKAKAMKPKAKPAREEAKPAKAKPSQRTARDKPAVAAKEKEKPRKRRVIENNGTKRVIKTDQQGEHGPGNTCQTLIKKLFLKDTEITTDEMVKQLKKDGWKPSRQVITTQLLGFRHSIRVLRDEGLITKRINL